MKKYLKIVMYLCFLCCFVSCVSRKSFGEEKIMYGKISDLDNNPVSDAEIYLNGSMKAKSDKNGNFTFQCFAFKENTIQVFSKIYQPFSEDFSLEHQSQFLQIRLREMDEFIEEAKQAFKEKKDAEAETILLHAIQENPKFQPSYLFLAFIYYKNNESELLENLFVIAEEAGLKKQNFSDYLPLPMEKRYE
jgi:hypothetical protein